MSDKLDVPPPGSGQYDPANKNIDAIGFALTQLRMCLMWIDEYHSSYLTLRKNDPELAEQELTYLTNTVQKAKVHFTRLSELMLAGYTFDPSKENPMADRSDDDFCRRHFGLPDAPQVPPWRGSSENPPRNPET